MCMMRRLSQKKTDLFSHFAIRIHNGSALLVTWQTRVLTHFYTQRKSNYQVIIKPPLATARAASYNVSNLELLTTYRKSYMGFSKNPLLDP